LPGFAECSEFVNADLIAAGLSPFAPERQALAAGKLMLERLDELAQSQSDFGFETTLAGRSHIRRLQRMKDDLGYRIAIYFLWLPSEEMAISRVATRVLQGGHDIPTQTIRRRYRQGMINFAKLYRPIADTWLLFDASQAPIRLTCSFEEGKRSIHDNAAVRIMVDRTPEIVE
jgi:predicted ABC-type ATPase